MPTLTLDLRSRRLVAGALLTLIEHLDNIQSVLRSQLPVAVMDPSDLAAKRANADRLYQLMLQTHDESQVQYDFDQTASSLLRTALAFDRRALAERVEQAQRQLTNPEAIAALDASVHPHNRLLDEFANESPTPLPRLATYLTVRGRAPHMPPLALADEERDPKHQVLLSAALIAQDTEAYRRHCEDRRLPFAVVFADIDNFKAFNSARGEVYVDRFVLPQILSAVEAAAFGHGRAYRHGGDEFLVLMPNADKGLALALARQVAASVGGVNLSDLGLEARLSIGVWVTHPESHLTSSELIEQASLAKQLAKTQGRGRVVLRVEVGATWEETIEVVP